MHVGTWLCAIKTSLVNTKILISKNFHSSQKSILILYFFNHSKKKQAILNFHTLLKQVVSPIWSQATVWQPLSYTNQPTLQMRKIRIWESKYIYKPIIRQPVRVKEENASGR